MTTYYLCGDMRVYMCVCCHYKSVCMDVYLHDIVCGYVCLSACKCVSAKFSYMCVCVCVRVYR